MSHLLTSEFWVIWVSKRNKNWEGKKQDKGTERSNSATSPAQSEHLCKCEHKFPAPKSTKGAKFVWDSKLQDGQGMPKRTFPSPKTFLLEDCLCLNKSVW